MTNYGAYTPSGEVFSQRVKFHSQSKICHYRPPHRVGGHMEQMIKIGVRLRTPYGAES